MERAYVRRFLSRFALAATTLALLWDAQALALGKTKTNPPGTPQTFAPRSEAGLRIISYNVWGLPSPLLQKPSRLRDIAREIPEVGADVIGFQEIFSRKTYQLAEMPPYPYVAWGRKKTGAQVLQGDGLLIVSRWPILEQDRISYTACSGTDCMSRKGAVYARIHVDGFGEIDVFNTHLNAGGSEKTRIAQMRQFAAFIASKRGDRPVFVTGDFNAQPGSEEYRAWMALTGMRDLHDEFRTHKPVGSSVQWNGFTMDPKRNQYYKAFSWFVKPRRIDYVFALDPEAGAATEVMSSRLLFDYKVGGRHLSDHFGIVMDLILRGE
ncbi:MAG: sphingomyelin phosphodiesterase [Bdellovibrionales bacterium]|nr:sphingomyelin phosphodiesterase [Bdellovibrionales bacterium]